MRLEDKLCVCVCVCESVCFCVYCQIREATVTYEGLNTNVFSCNNQKLINNEKRMDAKRSKLSDMVSLGVYLSN